MGALKLISGAAGYMKAVGPLKTLEAPEILTGGAGAIAALVMAVPVLTGDLTPSQAVDAGGVILMGLGGVWAGVTRIQAALENRRKAKAKAGEAVANGEVGLFQEKLAKVAPIKIDQEAPEGGRSQAAMDAVIHEIQKRPDSERAVRTAASITYPKRRQPKPMNGGRGHH
jgi:hypothetical protein